MEQASAQPGWHSRCVKSRSGCTTCKKRRLKCDETEPHCTRCIKSGLTCPGYNKPVKWSTKYEIDYSPDAASSSSSQLALYTPQDESSILLSHYYSDICQVASSFDSSQNPYRSIISEMIRDSPIIFNCVMTMSASHLSQLGNNGSEPLTFQTEAISHIARGIAEIDSGAKARDDLLLGIILLGMTTSWHDPSSLGLCHFHGARQLFRIWMVQNDMTQLQLPTSYTYRLIVSSMVYWEVMAACLIDQDIDAFSYLDIFSTQPPIFFSYPCPWTGIGTGVLIHLAKCLALVRRSRTRYHTESASSDSTLLDKAFALVQGLETTHIPTVEEIQNTEDLFTPTDHLYKIALCHQLIAKLELYKSFPELHQVFSQSPDGPMQIDHDQQNLQLAIEILKIMETIPENSRTVAIQTLIFISAGSSLGFHSAQAREIVTDWRRFVLNRLYRLYHRLRLQTINQAAAILKEVWLRMDLDCESPIMQVHWMDVMVDSKLETILG